MSASNDSVARFFATYPPGVAELAGSLRKRIQQTLPNAAETLDESGRVVGYGVGSGYQGLVCTIIPSKTGVKLGIVGSAALKDPQRLLEGTGKVHRYVQFSTATDLQRNGIDDLLKAAAHAAGDRLRSV